ncbi:MAG: alpha/beta fold hydrolase [Thermosynechococcaceae cyanobacterium MS004]|nr:alpha/beta fold hydrolase [Thermosynechococcaceae cyanobacterium MS004]
MTEVVAVSDSSPAPCQAPLHPPVPQGLPRLFWQWRGFDICYTVNGVGKPLFLIHGFGATHAHWRNNIPVLAAQGYRVFAIDLLGFGASEKPALDYSLELWQELIHDFWQAHIKQPMVVVGNSIGALLSLMVLAYHPDIVAGGIVLNVAGGLNHRPEELNAPLRAVMGLFAALVQNPITGRFLFSQVRKKHRIRNTLRQVYGNKAAITDELVELIYEPTCDRKAQKVFASILGAPPGPRISELLPKIHHPLLVLWGEADPWTPIQGSHIFQEWSTSAEGKAVQIIPIPETGHCPHDERPDVVNAFMIDWLNHLDNWV